MNMTEEKEDLVNHPNHYTSNESGIETIEVTSPLRFCPANSLKYLSRANLKGSTEQDLLKSVWYLEYMLKDENNATGATRGLSQKEISFVEGLDASENIKQAMNLIFEGAISGGAQYNSKSIQGAVNLIKAEAEKFKQED